MMLMRLMLRLSTGSALHIPLTRIGQMLLQCCSIQHTSVSLIQTIEHCTRHHDLRVIHFAQKSEEHEQLIHHEHNEIGN